MAKNKRTKREWFDEILKLSQVQDNPEMVEWIQYQQELLTRKNASGEKRMTPTQQLNEKLKNAIVEVLAVATKPMQIGEVLKAMPAEYSDATSQKISAMMTQLKAEKRVVRIEEKRKAFFAVA